jgi:hypothetical protein
MQHEPRDPDDPSNDPTRMANQPSLTTSQGTVWLVVGGLMAAIAVVLLLALLAIDTQGIALWAVVVIVLLYLAMVEVRLLVRRLRVRLGLMATCFGAIALVALAAVLTIGIGQG